MEELGLQPELPDRLLDLNALALGSICDFTSYPMTTILYVICIRYTDPRSDYKIYFLIDRYIARFIYHYLPYGSLI